VERTVNQQVMEYITEISAPKDTLYREMCVFCRLGNVTKFLKDRTGRTS